MHTVVVARWRLLRIYYLTDTKKYKNKHNILISGGYIEAKNIIPKVGWK